ncbi:MAG TPA: LamG domain-containing protein [Kofleriaceae bacterium]|nr:LamG domain-containing protein [Kofleriaceae bacterium]
MRGPAAALGLAALSACLEAPPRGIDTGGGRDSGVEPGGGDGAAGEIYHRELKIASNSVAEDLVDFPVLVRITGDDALIRHAAAGGDDISFVDEEDVLLPFEVEGWRDGELRAWVRLPSLRADASTAFVLRYGPGAPRVVQQQGSAWNDDFAAVWHLEEEPGAVADSSAGSHDAVEVAGATSSGDGQLGSGIAFDGGGDYIDFGAAFPAAIDVGAALTVTAWVRYDSKQDWAHFISKATTNTQGWGMGIDSTLDFMVRAMNGSSASQGYNAAAEPDTGVWYHWAMVYDGGAPTDAERLLAYRDGAGLSLTFLSSIPANFDSKGGDLYLGCATWRTSDYCIDGAVDEVHVSTVPRSPAWIAAEFANQRPDSTFIVVGPEKKL